MEKVTLYKKDSKGKIRTWSIQTDGPQIKQLSGILGSDKLVEHTKDAKPKNVGKSNETTPSEQAVSEAKSKIKKKLDKDYFSSIEEATNTKVILPMLAKNYDDHDHKIDWSKAVIAQPKLDGQRALAIVDNSGSVELISRDNLPIETMDHIKSSLKHLKGEIIDGELYAHGYSFQENMKLIKKYRKGETEKVFFNVYDMIQDKPFIKRYENLEKNLFSKNLPYIHKVENTQIANKHDLDTAHSKNLKDGYEGTIVRHGDAPYKIKGKSENLLKYKDFHDLSAEIIDIIPMDARPTHGKVVSRVNGEQFDATPKMSFQEREDLLTNKKDYIGKIGEFRYFEFSDTGVPRFCAFCGLRNDKTKKK